MEYERYCSLWLASVKDCRIFRVKTVVHTEKIGIKVPQRTMLLKMFRHLSSVQIPSMC